MFHYGYFVICQNGRLAPAGDDWGPTADTYKPGDVRGIKNGMKATVVDVIKGQEAALNHVDVMILLNEERTQELHPLEWIKLVASRMATARPRRLTSWPQIQADFQGQKLRAVRNKIYWRPKEETFQDFLINHLLWFLGEEWFNNEMERKPEERHIILRWRHERSEQLLKHAPPDADATGPLKAPMTGGAKALLVLADDVLQLVQGLDTPPKVSTRWEICTSFRERGTKYL
jgi:hypothetical protein